MISPREEWQLDTRRLGRRVLVYDRLDSTNTQAAALANDPANDGVAVLAHVQSAGRGQHGRSWLCPPGSGVLLSLLLFPPPALRRPALLTAWAAVSVCETILRATGLQAKIKWPNDVLIRGRKVCGILIEQKAVGSRQGAAGSDESGPLPAAEAPSALSSPAPGHRPTSPSSLPTAHCLLPTIVGIGLNANQSAEMFANADLPDASSLAVCTGRAFDTRQLARLLLEQLDEEYGRLCDGDVMTLEACWKWRLGLLGKPVVAECVDGVHRGRLCELAFDGLILEPPRGEPISLRPETVRQLRAL